MQAKFYEFNQNNSGGYFDVNDNVCHRVIIEANSEKEAIEKFEPMIENQSGSCACCGERWSLSTDEVDISKFKNGYLADVYTHYKDYEKKWIDLYGKFDRKEDPKVVKTAYGANIYATQIFFKNLEEYCQFMANKWGNTSPDIRIHYLNGRKLEIFKEKND